VSWWLYKIFISPPRHQDTKKIYTTQGMQVKTEERLGVDAISRYIDLNQ
jgi:hypothetical protein